MATATQAFETRTDEDGTDEAKCPCCGIWQDPDNMTGDRCGECDGEAAEALAGAVDRLIDHGHAAAALAALKAAGLLRAPGGGRGGGPSLGGTSASMPFAPCRPCYRPTATAPTEWSPPPAQISARARSVGRTSRG